MKKIAFIDPFINNPAFHCFNGFVDNFRHPTVYHMPGKYGFSSLHDQKEETIAYYMAGSASNITEPLPWHDPLAEFLISELKKGKPVFAACFGHQLLCKAFGSVVDFAFEDHSKLLGIRKMEILQDFWNFKEGETFTIPISHAQVVKELGPDLIAVGRGLENDIVIHKTYPLLATQGHPEASKHFCAFEIQNLSEDQEETGRRFGKIFIERFLKNFELI